MSGGTLPRTTRRVLRLTTAAIGVGAALFASTAVASADPADETKPDDGLSVETQDEDQQEPVVSGTVSKGPGVEVFVDPAGDDSNEPSRIATPEIRLDLDNGDQVITYCIDIETGIDDGANYVEAGWGEANPQSDLPHTLWVLENSYPNTSVAEVLTAAGVDTTGDPARDQVLVYAATQAAIWHFSDDAELVEQPAIGQPFEGQPSTAEYDMIQAIFAHLTDETVNTGIGEPQAPTLEISPTSVSGTLGEPMGPFTVTTNADSVNITATEGAKIVDANGAPVTTLKNGDQFFVVSTAQEATVTLSGMAVVPTGRVFVDKDDANSSQKLVLASPTEVKVELIIDVMAQQAPPETPEATPSPQPRGNLAETGATPWTKIGLGGLLVLAGVGLLVFTRMRGRGRRSEPTT